jgi:hypothetical protein
MHTLHFKLEWLLRCVNAIITGEALFSFLKDVDPPTFRRGLQQAEESVDTILNMLGVESLQIAVARRVEQDQNGHHFG